MTLADGVADRAEKTKLRPQGGGGDRRGEEAAGAAQAAAALGVDSPTTCSGLELLRNADDELIAPSRQKPHQAQVSENLQLLPDFLARMAVGGKLLLDCLTT